MYEDDELLALSGLQHIAFCERQWALIHLERQWEQDDRTVLGDAFHERAHCGNDSTKGTVRSVRGMGIKSNRLGIIGVADVVEFDYGSTSAEDGSPTLVPVEYKVGSPKVSDWDRIQVCAQAMCLEEMFSCEIISGALFYGETRRRQVVEMDFDLRRKVEELSGRMHRLFASGQTPPPKGLARCKRCSLRSICNPDVVGLDVSAYWEEEGFEF